MHKTNSSTVLCYFLDVLMVEQNHFVQFIIKRLKKSLIKDAQIARNGQFKLKKNFFDDGKHYVRMRHGNLIR